MEFKKIQEYIGNMSQVFSVKEYFLSNGKARGVHAVDICNNTGLELTLLPAKGLDIYQVRYKGKNLNFLTPNGIVAPQYYNCRGSDWLNCFFGGFLTTCGLNNIGSECEDNGELLPLHGKISNTPAENVTVSNILENGFPVVLVRGTIKSAALFGGNLSLNRTVKVKFGSNEIELNDVIQNDGYEAKPYMTLYHFNMGYPLLSEHARLIIPTNKITPRTPHAAQYMERYLEITPPSVPYEEMCYYHDLKADPQGNTAVGIENPVENLSVQLRFNKNILDHFVQWKMLGKGQYVMGLEPCNATIDGRADARKNGSLKLLNPGERIEHHLNVLVGECH